MYMYFFFLLEIVRRSDVGYNAENALDLASVGRTAQWKVKPLFAPSHILRYMYMYGCDNYRAGRCQEGVCYHLFSRTRHRSMLDYQVPEILRQPLQGLCLDAKLLAPPNTSIADFLAKAPEPPAFLIVRNAVHLLKVLTA